MNWVFVITPSDVFGLVLLGCIGLIVAIVVVHDKYDTWKRSKRKKEPTNG